MNKLPHTIKNISKFDAELKLNGFKINEIMSENCIVQAYNRIAEAKALLQHTDWTIADIAYALGFEYPTYFNIFFKKKEGRAPSALRK